MRTGARTRTQDHGDIDLLRTWVDIALEDRAKSGIDDAEQDEPPEDTSEPLVEALTVRLALADGSVFASVSTTIESTVQEVCADIIRQRGPCGRLRLYYQGSKLNEKSSLRDLGIRSDCRLDLEICEAVATSSEDGTARVWNASTGECDLVLRGHEKPVCSVTFAPDFRSLLTASEDCTAKIWAMDSGRCVTTLSGHSDAVFGGRFSADCGSVATASADGTARVWDASTGQCRFVLEGHACPVYAVAWENSDQTLVTSATDNTMKFWTAPAGPAAPKQMSGLERSLARKGPAPAAALKKGRCVRTASGTSQQYSSSFNAEGSAYVTAAGDNTATVCAADGTLLQRLEGHRGLVVFACFAVSEQPTGPVS